MTVVQGRVTYREVTRVPDFRWLLGGQALSVIGDEALRIALAVLVFQRSHSALATGLTMALTYLPYAVGGPLLAVLADRMSRRDLMVRCDIGRGLLVAAMVVPGQPVWCLLGWVALVTLLGPPFEAARSALLPDMLGPDRYLTGQSLFAGLRTAMQMTGFAVGGAVIALAGARPVIAADAATFALSALALRYGVRCRYLPAAATPPGRPGTPDAAGSAPRAGWLGDSAAGVRIIAGDPVLRWLVVLLWWLAFAAVLPVGAAAPLAAMQRPGSGWLVAGYFVALAAGMTLGALLVGRTGPAARQRLLLPTAAATLLPLVAFVARPPAAVCLGLVAALGVLVNAASLLIQSAFVLAVAPHQRGRAIGLAASGLYVTQGLGMLAAGALAGAFNPASGIGWGGTATLLVVLPVTAVAARALRRPATVSLQTQPQPARAASAT